jgi:hypothetical protein
MDKQLRDGDEDRVKATWSHKGTSKKVNGKLARLKSRPRISHEHMTRWLVNFEEIANAIHK